MRAMLVLSTALLCCSAAAQQEQTLMQWQFEEGLEGWGKANHVEDLRVEDGAMQGRIMDWDPFVTSPQFEIPATAWQVIEVRLKTDCPGTAEFFWTNTTRSRFGGFSPGKETRFEVTGDGQWHVYRVRPYWHTEERIILLRLDLPRRETEGLPEAEARPTFAVDYIRIVDLGEPASESRENAWDFSQAAEGWAATGDASAEATDEGLRVQVSQEGDGGIVSGPLRLPVEDRFWVFIEMAVDAGDSGMIRWVSSEHAGMVTHRFPVRPDGRMHVYNVDISSSRQWSGELLLLGLTPSLSAGATATVRRIAVAEEPQGPPEVEVTWAGLEDALPRAGGTLPFVISLINRGGETAEGVSIHELTLPPGVTVAADDGWRQLPPLESFEIVTHRFGLSAPQPATGTIELALSGHGAPPQPTRTPIDITPSLDLPPADYVPQPQPVPCQYEIGAYYFPGWPSRVKWEPVERSAPERKPVLGWYDESDPEVCDWQIKWAVEHGISFFMVDWYWNAGSRHLEHWVHDAYMNARYRRYLKWCMMWANHNPAGSHSEEDQRAVTRYWLDNYFGMEEYYRIDGRPVVIIWSPERMRQDMGGSDGVRRLLEISQQMAREAGYPGICFIAMKWPETSTDPATIRRLADEGFEMTTIYHYMGHRGNAADPQHYAFELVAESTLPFLQAWREADILPFLPAISTGWDSRPWHGDRARVVHGRTVPLFRRICEDVRRFADDTGLRRLALGPLNEWGEGSYIEPCREFGFGMYDVIRDTFCQMPQGGWPPNVTPQDVGLGPYDLPPAEARTAWDFQDGTQGWGPFMGVTDFRAEEGAICFRTTSPDPAIAASLRDVRAVRYPAITIRMRMDAVADDGERGQLFWATATSPVSEANSVRFDLIGDGEYHDYVLPMAESDRWRGRIVRFRLDPCSHTGAQVCIDEIRLEARE
ncbi:MAG: glycoside hydrolase family 99-like domain-containing protein [Armatimonadota bacterium]|nr:glycoside hydrolase family 99-like domain-containing protein [Armatimonadota bacterium]